MQLTEIQNQRQLSWFAPDPGSAEYLAADLEQGKLILLEGITPDAVDLADYSEASRLRGRLLFIEIEQNFQGAANNNPLLMPSKTRVWIPVPHGTQVWLVTPRERLAIDVAFLAAVLLLCLAGIWLGGKGHGAERRHTRSV